MIAAGELSKEDTVVEVGPGFGVLTLSLAKEIKHVIAFEIEQQLRPYWEDKMNEHKNIEVVWGNVLHQFEKEEERFPDGYKVIANVPYQITSHLLRTFLEAKKKPERIIVMVQKEVAERMCAKKGDMSLLALSVQYYGTPRIVMQVPKGNFWPQPKVDSAVVAITDIHAQDDSERFFAIARAGFANKRKQLWKNIANGCSFDGDKVKAVLKDVVRNELIRAEDVSAEEWREIVARLK